MLWSLGLFTTVLVACAPLGAMTSIVTTAAGGTFYVRSQTVDQTFVAPLPEVTQAVRRALGEMALTIKEEEAREGEYYFLAAASGEYEVEVTLTPVTRKATRVSVNADSLPERDKATGREIINQVALALGPPPPPQFALAQVSPREQTVPAVQRVHPIAENQALVLSEPPPVPPERTGSPPPSPSPPDTRAFPAVVQPESSAARPTVQRDSLQMTRPADPQRKERVDAEQLYEVALHEYVRGDFPAAIEDLRAYLAAQPDDAGRPRALYWLGEALYSQREYADALLQFETILRDYPRSPETLRALLTAAHAYRQLGETQRAETLLRTLIRQHPKSREAQVARTLMVKQ